MHGGASARRDARSTWPPSPTSPSSCQWASKKRAAARFSPRCRFMLVLPPPSGVSGRGEPRCLSGRSTA
eukprot:10088819-Prorocentrum_lima.AAC.1